MIVEKTDILCNGRIIKYLSAHSVNGSTESSGDEQQPKRKNEKNKGIPIEASRTRAEDRQRRRDDDAKKNRVHTFQIKCRKYVFRTVSMLMWLWIFNDSTINADGITKCEMFVTKPNSLCCAVCSVLVCFFVVVLFSILVWYAHDWWLL